VGCTESRPRITGKPLRRSGVHEIYRWFADASADAPAVGRRVAFIYSTELTTPILPRFVGFVRERLLLGT
jgi:hypothetical protein